MKPKTAIRAVLASDSPTAVSLPSGLTKNRRADRYNRTARPEIDSAAKRKAPALSLWLGLKLEKYPSAPLTPWWALRRRSINSLLQSRAAKVWRFISQLALVGLREGPFFGD
jgi:hypothetical protein